MPKKSDGEEKAGPNNTRKPSEAQNETNREKNRRKPATDYKPNEFRPKKENKIIKNFIQEMRFNQKLPEYQAYVQLFEALQNRLLKQLT